MRKRSILCHAAVLFCLFDLILGAHLQITNPHKGSVWWFGRTESIAWSLPGLNQTAPASATARIDLFCHHKHMITITTSAALYSYNYSYTVPARNLPISYAYWLQMNATFDPHISGASDLFTIRHANQSDLWVIIIVTLAALVAVGVGLLLLFCRKWHRARAARREHDLHPGYTRVQD